MFVVTFSSPDVLYLGERMIIIINYDHKRRAGFGCFGQNRR